MNPWMYMQDSTVISVISFENVFVCLSVGLLKK